MEVTKFFLKNEEGIGGIGSFECSNREWQELISTYILPGIFTYMQIAPTQNGS